MFKKPSKGAQAVARVGIIAFLFVVAIFSLTNNSTSAADQKSWHMDPEGIAAFVNSKGYHIPYEGALNFDSATAKKVCEIAGYNTVVSMDTKYPEKLSATGYRDGWYSPWDNTLANWNGHTFNVVNAAHAGNRWISSLTCGDPIITPTPTPTPTPTATPKPTPTCSDGKDNDHNGYADSADSSCHTDHNPKNPKSYNPDWNEGGSGNNTCADSIDNNHNGLIDGGDPICHTDGDAKNPSSYDGNRREKGEHKPTPTPKPTATPTPVPCSDCEDEDESDDSTTIITENNVVVITGDEDDEDTIELLKTDDLETVKPGEASTYRIVVRNNKDHDLTNVKIIDRLPVYLHPLATKPYASADANSRTITWDDQTISANSEVTFSLRVRVDSGAPNGFLLQNVAVINGDGIRANASDSTLIQGAAAQVAGATISAPQAVPVSAKTGVPFDTVSTILSLSGTIATAGTLIAKKLI